MVEGEAVAGPGSEHRSFGLAPADEEPEVLRASKGQGE